jgi:Coenzyme PQQ synthesis protein D (PqqD)
MTGDARTSPWGRPSADVVARRLGDETVLVHLGTNQIYRLNRTGSRFWELLMEGNDRTTTEERLLDEFEIDAASLRVEIAELLRRLADSGLVTPLT